MDGMLESITQQLTVGLSIEDRAGLALCFSFLL